MSQQQADWLVQYRCLYREHWYDDSVHDTGESAVIRAAQVAGWGRRCRVVDPYGYVVWDSYSSGSTG